MSSAANSDNSLLLWTRPGIGLKNVVERCLIIDTSLNANVCANFLSVITRRRCV